jgi:hypothetical protein
MAWNTIPTRPNVKPTEQVMGLIAPSHCWHFDAWLYEVAASDDLLLRVETRAGGRDLLTSALYRWDGERLRYTAPQPEDQRAVTINARHMWSRAAELGRLHKRVLTMAARVPSGFRSRSVALHYVRAPDVHPITGE